MFAMTGRPVRIALVELLCLSANCWARSENAVCDTLNQDACEQLHENNHCCFRHCRGSCLS